MESLTSLSTQMQMISTTTTYKMQFALQLTLEYFQEFSVKHLFIDIRRVAFLQHTQFSALLSQF